MLAACSFHEGGQEKRVYSVSATSLAENCETFRAVVARDNVDTRKTLAVMGWTAETFEIFEEILPGGPSYTVSVKGVGEGDDISRELADAPMRHYHISRIKRAKGDMVGESAELLKSSLNQTSYKELRQSGRFSLGASPVSGGYLPAVCRMQAICQTRKADRHLLSPRCKNEW